MDEFELLLRRLNGLAREIGDELGDRAPVAIVAMKDGKVAVGCNTSAEDLPALLREGLGVSRNAENIVSN